MSKSKIYAVTDIGSNTVKCSVYRVSDPQNIEDIEFMSQKLGLIALVENQALNDNAVSLLCDTVLEYKKRAEELGADVFAAFGTAIMRKITNFDEVCRSVKEKTGVDIDLISGEEEARLSFSGARMLSPELSHGIMADMGGGSTELIAFENDSINSLYSFPFGCLSLYKEYVKERFPAFNEANEIQTYVTDEISKHAFTSAHDQLILVGGTGKAISKVLCELGYSSCVNPIEVLYALEKRFNEQDPDDIAMLEHLVPARVETIIPGLLAYIAIAKRANAKTFAISGGGIRDGYLKKLITKDGI